jgi:hypothetical protein
MIKYGSPAYILIQTYLCTDRRGEKKENIANRRIIPLRTLSPCMYVCMYMHSPLHPLLVAPAPACLPACMHQLQLIEEHGKLTNQSTKQPRKKLNTRVLHLPASSHNTKTRSKRNVGNGYNSSAVCGMRYLVNLAYMYKYLFGSMYVVCMYVCGSRRHQKTGTGNVRYDVQRSLIWDERR